jgi:hypothetical protein
MRPDTFIVGAPKCGTSSLFAYLQQHPLFFGPSLSEPYFFGRDLTIEPRRRVLDEASYLRLFAEADRLGARRCGEASVYSMLSREAASEMRAFNPEARVIALLRDPIDLVRSLHWQELADRNETEPVLARALSLQGERAAGRCLPETCYHPGSLQYVRVATFAPQLARYYEAFGRERVLVLLLDDLRLDAAGTVGRVFDFLGLDRVEGLDLRPRNTARPLLIGACPLGRRPRWGARTLIPRPAASCRRCSGMSRAPRP